MKNTIIGFKFRNKTCALVFFTYNLFVKKQDDLKKVRYLFKSYCV